MERLIHTESLTKLYGVVIGVNDITLDIKPGVHGLLGPNGAGKSTFLKLITGQMRPTEGWIRVMDQDPWNNPTLFERIGYCPEQDAFYTFLSGLDFVMRLAQISGMEESVARTKAEEAMERVGATGFMHRKISGYSKGMRQRTKLAQALVHDPEFLILDEPLTGTDPIGRRDLIKLVRDLGKSGKSILVASHVLHEVQSMTEDFLMIFGGRVLASGNVHEIRDVMDDHPHRIELRCDRPRELAVRMMAGMPVRGVEMDEEGGRLSILTQDPNGFYKALPGIVLEGGFRIAEMDTQDDNLDAVFDYLVSGH